MAFKPAVSRGRTRRSKFRDKPSMTLRGDNYIVLQFPELFLKNANFPEDATGIDVFMGTGKDEGKVRIEPGNQYVLTNDDTGKFVRINPKTTVGFDHVTKRLVDLSVTTSNLVTGAFVIDTINVLER